MNADCIEVFRKSRDRLLQVKVTCHVTKHPILVPSSSAMFDGNVNKWFG